MKECPSCSRKYVDSANFCPACGVQLVNAEPEQEKQRESFLKAWGGALLAAVGFAVAWYLSTLAGAVIAICGVIWNSKSQNMVGRTSSTIIAVIVITIYKFMAAY